MVIPDHATVLFQGDSITDAGRNRNDTFALGGGYAFMAAARFGAMFPEKKVRFLNRGVSGDRVRNLQERWQADCLDLQPDVLSIMIGVNDMWRRYDGANDPTTPEAFEEGYRDILHRAREAGVGQLVMMEPFLLVTNDERQMYYDDLNPKIQVVRRLAREFNAVYVPLDGLFAAASVRREPGFWATDGVHPTAPGAAFIADAWLRAVGACV